MEKTVRDLKIGNRIKTIISPMSQKYMRELDDIENIYGKNSDEYKVAEKEYYDIWGERNGILIQIGECFADCKIRTDSGDEVSMFNNIVGNLGHWNEESDIGGAKFFVNLEIKDYKL